MITLHDIARTPTLLARKLQKFERQGRYDEALQDCLEIIDGEARLPALEAALPNERAELLLRYGALIGFAGQKSQIANAQEQSKDVLTKALGEFIVLADKEKSAECENYIALSYWRLGELNEGFVWLESSFARQCPKRSYPRLHAFVVASLINIERKRFKENVKELRSVEDDFLAFGDDYLTGMLYSNLAVSLKDLGLTADALTCFELSRYYHSRSKHRVYEGIVENNISLLYRDLGQFGKAHSSIDRAIKIFKGVRDKTRVGYALDTKAVIFLSQGEYERAREVADLSIDILQRGENSAYAVESLLTRSKILVHLDKFADAVLSLMQAVDLQKVKVGENAARELIDEFESEIEKLYSTGAKAKTVGFEELSGVGLLLPPSLGLYNSFSAVRINNSHLEQFGLSKGALAVIVDETVRRGDLVALEEIKDGSVRCGIYDSDFGLVCLERVDGDPELFNADDVRLLGKIVGVGTETSTSKGQVVVQTLKTASSTQG
jgi:tetratricopeptide (TPR) repeat protein